MENSIELEKEWKKLVMLFQSLHRLNKNNAEILSFVNDVKFEQLTLKAFNKANIQDENLVQYVIELSYQKLYKYKRFYLRSVSRQKEAK
jgi:hypothetical protein